MQQLPETAHAGWLRIWDHGKTQAKAAAKRKTASARPARDLNRLRSVSRKTWRTGWPWNVIPA